MKVKKIVILMLAITFLIGCKKKEEYSSNERFVGTQWSGSYNNEPVQLLFTENRGCFLIINSVTENFDYKVKGFEIFLISAKQGSI